MEDGCSAWATEAGCYAESCLEDKPCEPRFVDCVHIMQTEFISAVVRTGKVVTLAMIMFLADVHELCSLYE